MAQQHDTAASTGTAVATQVAVGEHVDAADAGPHEQAPVHKRPVGTWIAAAWVLLVVLLGVLGPWLPLPDPTEPLVGTPQSGPSLEHPLGTDFLGKDLLSQVIAGARTSLLVAGSSVVAGFLLGGLAGIAAGFLKGGADRTVLWITDVLLAFPALVLALALVSFAGRSLESVIIAISVGAVPIYARVARATTLVLAEQEYVLAARAMGARPIRILFREIAPNAAIQLLAYAALGASIAIIAEGGLAYIGLGVPDTVSWGSMIAEGQQHLDTAPQAALSAVCVMFLTIVALNLLGERLGASIDPRGSQLD